MPIQFSDTPQRYGAVSRILHWGMALLFVWQFVSATLHRFAEDTPAEKFFWPGHGTVGLTILWLVLLRGAWGLINLRNRPPHMPGLAGRAARAGHLALYVLMIVIPLLSVLRVFGRGRELSYLGIQLFGASGEKTQWLVDLAGLLHGELGWLFFALVAGHALIALLHVRLLGTAVLHRMGWGKA